jgi:release factor glutamine methyltransferase
VRTLADARVGGVLRDGVARLTRAGIATARQDAELLLARVLATTRLALHLAPDQAMEPDAVATFAALLQRRAGHEPLQYLLGVEDFAGVRVAVGPGAFIPRPETELLVERAVACCADAAGPMTVVDVCTGSGAIACAVAARVPGARVWAIELDPVAAGWARANVARLELADRVRVLDGDLFAPLPGADMAGSADLVLANPPYIAGPAMAELPVEVRDWEPARALDGGADGLTVVERILDDAPAVLRRGGRVLVEIGHDHADRVRARLASDARYRRPVFHRDLLGYERVLEVEVA